MPHPESLTVTTPAGVFRILDFGGDGAPVLFLHGLTGVAEVWGPTVEALGGRVRALAMDQRGHGHSPKPASGYAIGPYVGDAVAVIEALDLAPVHVVGHSMGARVAMVLGARRPALLHSAAVIDIGPEAWRANWQASVAGIRRIPASFPDLATALATASRARSADSLDAALNSTTLGDIAAARFAHNPDGTVSFLASRSALEQSVVAHRSHDYWAEWRRIGLPLLLVRGGASAELRPRIATRMRETNPRAHFVELAGVPHNIPLIAPTALARTLVAFWSSAG
jgi:pimeloyl-ACP methyl ester carboxylesterase